MVNRFILSSGRKACRFWQGARDPPESSCSLIIPLIRFRPTASGHEKTLRVRKKYFAVASEVKLGV
jgi:hypothetical protein